MRDRARSLLGRLRPGRGSGAPGLDLPSPEPIRQLTPREAYLVRVAADLPFDEAERAEVIEELASHVADSTAQLSATGLALDEAERQALDRLGPPDRLADELARARRSTRRLLAAVGAGTWAATGGLVAGWLGGFFLLLALMFALLLPLMGLAALLHWEPPSLSGDGWNNAETLLVLGVALWTAAARLTSTVARRAGYSIEDVRRVVAAVGALVLVPWALFVWSGPLNWPGLLILVSLPAWFALGSWRAEAPERRRRMRAWLWAAGGVTAIVVLVALPAFMSPVGTLVVHQPPQMAQPVQVPPTRPWARIGAQLPDTTFGGTVRVDDDAYAQKGVYAVTIREESARVLAGWHDLRAEAWPGVQWPTGEQLPRCYDAAAARPFAVAPLGATTASAGTVPASFAGSVRYDTVPGLDYACLAATGVAPDGVRYILGGPQTVQTAFRGTAWDFLAAVAAGR